LVIVIAAPRLASGGFGSEPLPYVEFIGLTGGLDCWKEGWGAGAEGYFGLNFTFFKVIIFAFGCVDFCC
jgi:hypothetical protein